MDLELRKAIAAAIAANPDASKVIKKIEMDPSGAGTIHYEPAGIWIDPSAPGFSTGKRAISDEELVRAYLVTRLVSDLGYPAGTETLEIERVYKPVGRPTGKGGRIDVLVREKPKATKKKSGGPPGRAYLFIECKAPEHYDHDMKYIDGQLFLLSRQEMERPKYLVYYTVELRDSELLERIILVDTDAFASFKEWDDAGQPLTDVIPAAYGKATKKRYANVPTVTTKHRPLRDDVTPQEFARLRTEMHDVIWGGGGTNNNEVFVYITKLILAKIYDESETATSKEYEFQRLGDAVTPETPEKLAERMNDLYKRAEAAYLALPKPSAGPAFDTARISEEKIAFVVGRLEGISMTENAHPGDLLGEFFEQIVSQDFTQTKGQFFTAVKLVRFMLHLAAVDEQAADVMQHQKDHLGRPRLPYVIDPSEGSGTFLIEYMKLIRDKVGDPTVAQTLPKRLRNEHQTWFGGPTQMVWAKTYVYGIENNYDLGLSSKVNMVLHGDGSGNTFITSGLLPFDSYDVDGAPNVLAHVEGAKSHPYGSQRNEQFDLILSNPPFSLDLSPDEKKTLTQNFSELPIAKSEALFVERWYQLLREGGYFCCVLPEAVADTSTNLAIRLFLLQHFRIHAVVALPYDAFRPFTSTKTCIVYAQKRPATDVSAWHKAWSTAEAANKGANETELAAATIAALGWGSDRVFMAEPEFVGYKRRKNLPDLPRPNRLYVEGNGGHVTDDDPSSPTTVLGYFRAPKPVVGSPELGFYSTLDQIAGRQGLRIDPKYRWLWDHQGGVAWGNPSKAKELSNVLDLVKLTKVKKGELLTDTAVIDLEHVESAQAIIRDGVPVVDVIGSDRVSFDGAELVISKLEPYLGKVIVEPPPDAIGSTEWVGLKRKGSSTVPLTVIAYLLMLPSVREACRRLQSGKRHARLEPAELLDLKVELPKAKALKTLANGIATARASIFKLREDAKKVRASIDGMF